MTNESKVFVQRSFDCHAEKLFDWLTKPDMIAQWFGPEGFAASEVTSELRAGGAYTIQLSKMNGPSFTVFGTYIEIDKPLLLRFTYDYKGLEGRPPSTVTFKLTPTGQERTELSMVQQFEVEIPDFATRTEAWNHMFERLAEFV